MSTLDASAGSVILTGVALPPPSSRQPRGRHYPLAETQAEPPGGLKPTAEPLHGVSVPGYEVLGLLGKGGMGVVFRARQVRLNRLVALKMILADGAADPLDLARFRAEAEAAARLHHPHVVQVYETGEADGRPWFSLELVEGGTLAERVNGTPLPAREAARLVEAAGQPTPVAS